MGVSGAAVGCGTNEDPLSAETSASPLVSVVQETDAAVTPSPTPTPEITTRTETETESIPFDTIEEEDPDLGKGKTEQIVEGVEGVLTRTFEVELADGVEVSRTLVAEEVTTDPIDEVIAVGTYEPPPEPEPEPPPEPEPEPESDCDPNYEGACVPIDSDVDCAGGSGNGPSYVEGPVRVVGSDIYRLDSDDDGVGCES